MERKIILFITSLIVCIVFITGCNKEETTENPVINLKTDIEYVYTDTIISMGTSVKFGIVAYKGNVNLTNLIIKINDAIFLDTGMNVNSLNIDKIITKGIENREHWVFTIIDKEGKSSSVSLTLTKDSSSTFGPVYEYSSVILGAQNNSTMGSFYSLSNNSVYILNEAYANQELIDILYYYDFLNGEENTISSPGANIDVSVFTGLYELSNWTTKKTTRYKQTTLTIGDFNSVTNDSLLLAAYGSTDGYRKAKNLKTGDIYSFKTEDNRMGLFKVNSVTGTDTGTIDITIKVQQ